MKSKYVQSCMRFSAIAILLSIFLFQCTPTQKAVDLKSGDINNMVNSHEFVFVTDRVTPLRGRTRNLTSTYDVTVKKDSLVSYLPFFGRAYQAPMNSIEGGIQFTSTNFSYEVNARKNNGWDVIIKPKDYRDVQQFSFSIFDNGSATLNVTSTYKDPISFSGHVEKIKE